MSRLIMTKSIFVCLLIFNSFSVFSQNVEKLYEKAQLNFEAHKYNEALEYFREVYDSNPALNDVEYKLEICRLMTSAGDDRSLTTYLGFETTYGAEDDHYFYYLGKIYARRYQIAEAIAAFDKFQQRMDYSGRGDEELSKELLTYSKRLKYYFENPDNYEIHQLEAPVNSKGNELTPVFFEKNDELLFASDRDNYSEKPFRIFYTKQSSSGWSPLTEVKNLGSFTESNANIEVVKEDGRLFIFREENGGDLFYSQPNGDDWTLPVEFDSKVSNNHIASHFFINEHEDRIIFASAENGLGLDIYESFKSPENGKWSKPNTFYSTINSAFNEDSPYLSPDENKLYFCSDRPGGLGGYDVYVTTFDPATYSWSEPENLGWPINSPDDEFHFKMNANQSSGYFVSNRLHTKGGFDIYFFWEVQKVKVEGRIFDENAGGPLVDAEIRFRPSQYLDEYFSSKVDQSGRYSAKVFSDEIFNVEIIRNGIVIHTEKFEIHDNAGQPTTHVKDFTVK